MALDQGQHICPGPQQADAQEEQEGQERCLLVGLLLVHCHLARATRVPTSVVMFPTELGALFSPVAGAA